MPEIGASAPDLDLRDLRGRQVELAVQDRDTFVLFWNPACAFCSQMLDDVRTFDSSPPLGAPRLVLISNGSIEENEAMGVGASIVLDPASTAGRAFGTVATPSGILVDAEGRVASSLAIGAPAVMALVAGANGP